jgi:cell filamentation protein
MSGTKRYSREQAIYENLVYPGTEVLRNKLGIAEQAGLDRAEADSVFLLEPSRPVFRKFTLAEMQAVHKHLLEDVYDWAGKIRTYTTGRNATSFARPEYIESYFETAILKPLQRENFLKGTTSEQFAERGAYFACEVNAVHPFIDGNGRVTRLFLKDLAAQAGYHFDIVRIESSEEAWYEAMKLGFERSDLSRLKAEILNALSPLKILQSAGYRERAESGKPLQKNAPSSKPPDAERFLEDFGRVMDALKGAGSPDDPREKAALFQAANALAKAVSRTLPLPDSEAKGKALKEMSSRLETVGDKPLPGSIHAMLDTVRESVRPKPSHDEPSLGM